MHRPDRRRCDCLKYVCTAITIGQFRNKPPKIKDTEYCVVCEKGIQVPRVCSLYKEVAYCVRMHQTQHWSEHKKVCTGRNKMVETSKHVDGGLAGVAFVIQLAQSSN